MATVQQQYGVVVKSKSAAMKMPVSIRRTLDAQLNAIHKFVGGKEVKREFVWISAGMKDKSDPLGQYGYAGGKIVVETKVNEAWVIEALVAEGWRRSSTVDSMPRGVQMEFKDLTLDGKTSRWVRPRPDPDLTIVPVL